MADHYDRNFRVTELKLRRGIQKKVSGRWRPPLAYEVPGDSDEEDGREQTPKKTPSGSREKRKQNPALMADTGDNACAAGDIRNPSVMVVGSQCLRQGSP